MKHNIKIYGEQITIEHRMEVIPQCPWIKPFKVYEIRHPNSVGCYRGAKQKWKTFKKAITGMKAFLNHRIIPLVEEGGELDICPDCGNTIDKGACFYCKMD